MPRKLMELGAAALAGLIFGFGLILSGMTNPAKVLGFLDLGGAWDPSLALVMVGAIGVALLPFCWLRRRGQALCGAPLALATDETRASPALLVGSLFFGTGWGLAGFCPGPALVGLASGWAPAAIFCAGMLGGFLLFGVLPSAKDEVGS